MAIPFQSRRVLMLPAVPLWLAGVFTDALLIGSIFVLALIVRWPNLLSSPPSPSVGQSVLAALAMAEGRAWPLADQAPYLGAPFIYLLAAVYKLFGPGVEATMYLAWLVGGLTVPPVYLLGKAIAGRSCGIVAATLLATSPAHTVISSHVPWVHSLTPLFATTSLWLLVRWLMQRDPRSLVLAGLCAGVALQSHPTALPLLAGCALAALLRGRGTGRLRSSAMLTACVVIGYSPLLLHHVQTHFQVVDDVQGKRARYLDADTDAGERADRGVYLNNLEELSASLVRLTAGELLDDRPSAGAYLRDPRLVLYPLLGIAGLVVGRGRMSWILLAGLIPAILLPPLLNGKYKPVLDGRYLMPLVPVLFVGVGCLVAEIGKRLSGSRLQPVAALAMVAAITMLAVHPLYALDRYYEESSEDGASNQLYLRTLQAVRDQRQPGETVWLDPRLRDVKMPAGASAGSTLAWMLPVSGVPVDELADDLRSSIATDQLLILHRTTATEIRGSVELTHVDGNLTSRKDQPAYRVVRARQP